MTSIRSEYFANLRTREKIRVPVLVASILTPSVLTVLLGALSNKMAISSATIYLAPILYFLGIACIAMFLWSVLDILISMRRR